MMDDLSTRQPYSGQTQAILAMPFNCILSSNLSFLLSKYPVFIIAMPLRGSVKLKEIPKIREKLGSGWVAQAPTRILHFLRKMCGFLWVFL